MTPSELASKEASPRLYPHWKKSPPVGFEDSREAALVLDYPIVGMLGSFDDRIFAFPPFAQWKESTRPLGLVWASECDNVTYDSRKGFVVRA